jgi:hypothetical protein
MIFHSLIIRGLLCNLYSIIIKIVLREEKDRTYVDDISKGLSKKSYTYIVFLSELTIFHSFIYKEVSPFK